MPENSQLLIPPESLITEFESVKQPSDDTSGKFVKTYAKTPVKVNPFKMKKQKIFPLPQWQEVKEWYLTESLAGELVEQFPRLRERDHVHRVYGVPKFSKKIKQPV